jgi:hypothetical protein
MDTTGVQLPVVSDIVAFYRDYKKEQEKEAMRKIGKVRPSAPQTPPR